MICTRSSHHGMRALPMTREKTIKYNERPWGQVSASRWDEGNWHGLYLMAFKDSFNKWEPISGAAGVGKTRRPLTVHFHLGLGYTLGVTARDNWNYIDSGDLAIGVNRLRSATFQMTYIQHLQ